MSTPTCLDGNLIVSTFREGRLNTVSRMHRLFIDIVFRDHRYQQSEPGVGERYVTWNVIYAIIADDF